MTLYADDLNGTKLVKGMNMGGLDSNVGGRMVVDATFVPPPLRNPLL